MRTFEYVDRIISDGIQMLNPGFDLPKRSTKNSAGYDFVACEDTEILPISDSNLKPTLVRTGVKVQLLPDEFLMLANRSSNPGKRNLVLANSIGVIDADYYSNPDNDGEIMFAFYNIGYEPVQIKKGDKIGQGIFIKFVKIDNDNALADRNGGFGSTGD